MNDILKGLTKYKLISHFLLLDSKQKKNCSIKLLQLFLNAYFLFLPCRKSITNTSWTSLGATLSSSREKDHWGCWCGCKIMSVRLLLWTRECFPFNPSPSQPSWEYGCGPQRSGARCPYGSGAWELHNPLPSPPENKKGRVQIMEGLQNRLRNLGTSSWSNEKLLKHLRHVRVWKR